MLYIINNIWPKVQEKTLDIIKNQGDTNQNNHSGEKRTCKGNIMPTVLYLLFLV